MTATATGMFVWSIIFFPFPEAGGLLTTMKRDKQKVVDEVWDDEQVASFLGKVPPDLPGDPDFHVLLFAYRSMRATDFARFLDFYVDAGRDVTAKNGDGVSMTHYLSRHARAGPYIDLLEAAAARSGQ